MFSDDDQLHHDIDVLNQNKPTTPGAFTQDEPIVLEGPDPAAIWLCCFALLILLIGVRQIEWYWSLIYTGSTVAWLEWKRR